jgi:hypothetical protein
MIKETLYFDFSNQLVDKFYLPLEDILFDFFESTDKIGAFMPCQIDGSELPLFQIFQDLEIINCGRVFSSGRIAYATNLTRLVAHQLDFLKGSQQGWRRCSC